MLLDGVEEILYGGAAGGGKSDALLMAALQYVDVPGYSAVIFRRTYPQLTAADGIIPRSMEWLAPTDAQWNEQKSTWTFPSGATLSFKHLQYEKDKYNHQGAAYQFQGWDELTQFEESQYTYLTSRLRRPEGSSIPLRIRATANPGGIGHAWVKRRFLVEASPDRLFIPAKLADNPSMDQEYRHRLEKLPELERRRLLDGDWDVEAGTKFDRSWFKVEQQAPVGLRWVRFWDLAITEKQKADRTAGALCAFDADGHLWIRSMVKGRWEWPEGERTIIQTAQADGRLVEVGVEAISGFKIAAQSLRRAPALLGHTLRPTTHLTGDKVARAAPWQALAEQGCVHLVEGAWVSDFLDECVGFPEGKHDDQVDAVSGAVAHLATSATGTAQAPEVPSVMPNLQHW